MKNKARVLSLVLVAFVFIILLTVSVIAMAADDENESGGYAEYSTGDVVMTNLTAYSNSSFYRGNEIKTDLVAEDLFTLTVNSHGGIAKDGNGNLVFANYATVSISINTTDASMKIPGTNTTIISDRTCAYGGAHVGKSSLQELKTIIGYGVFLTSREDADGDREIYEELYVRHHTASMDELRITEDGNYHIVILVNVNENGTKKKIAIEYVIPIRTNIYITDSSGEYQVKDAGAYYEGVRLDALGRPDVTIKVDGAVVPDGYLMNKVGKHKIEVRCNGFLSESFEFEIFSKNGDHTLIYLSNSRRQLDNISYECENNFSVKWAGRYDSQMTYWKNSDPSKIYKYTSGTVINEPGIYVFTLNTPSLANERKTFLVHLVDNDCPVINYNTLHTNRFNNFKTKWYEVYDNQNQLYYCFSVDEYLKAYDAAVTVERARVEDYGYYFVYEGQRYSDKILITQAINKNAEKNIRIVYYDPSAEQIEKYFSDKNFDSTVYLNQDFQFVRTSVAESNSIVLISENGEETKIDYFRPISEYDLPSGKYLVIEKDKYDNKTEYSVIIDRESPEASLKINGADVKFYSDMMYTARYFEITEIIDELDKYAVACISRTVDGKTIDEYYYRDESSGVMFTEPGLYRIRLYDRNNNITNFNVNISQNKLYTLTNIDDGILLKLAGSGVVVNSVYLNGELVDDFVSNGSIQFNTNDFDQEYIVHLTNTFTGENDCARICLAARVIEENDDGNTDADNNDGGGEQPQNKKLPFGTAIGFVIGAAIGALAACGFGIYKVWTASDDRTSSDDDDCDDETDEEEYEEDEYYE